MRAGAGVRIVASHTKSIMRFGVFELDRKAGRLNRNGRSTRLPQQPMQLLVALTEFFVGKNLARTRMSSSTSIMV